MVSIYAIENPSGSFYIGQSIKTKRRFTRYRAMDCKSQVGLYNSFKKYGVNNHKFSILHLLPYDIDRKVLDNYELFYIKNDKKMAKESSKQRLANLIQSYEQAVKSAQSLYDDDDLKQWAIDHSLLCQDKIKDVKKKLKDTFSIDYNATDAKKKVIKEGSEVEVLVNHMDGMKGGTAKIKSYSLPANISDITMKDGMKMKDHKWLTNDEVKLK